MRRLLNVASVVLAVLAGFLSIMGLVTHGNTADSDANINREAMWTSLTLLLVSLAVVAAGLARMAPERPAGPR